MMTAINGQWKEIQWASLLRYIKKYIKTNIKILCFLAFCVRWISYEIFFVFSNFNGTARRNNKLLSRCFQPLVFNDLLLSEGGVNYTV